MRHIWLENSFYKLSCRPRLELVGLEREISAPILVCSNWRRVRKYAERATGFMNEAKYKIFHILATPVCCSPYIHSSLYSKPIFGTMAPIHFIVLATLALTVEASSACWNSVRNDTIGCYNSAPLTFTFNMNTASDCQKWCGKVEKCQSWIYVDHSGQCDLHRTTALTISDNIGFTFGGCDPVNDTLPVASLVPSFSIAATSTPASTRVEMETGYSVRSTTLIFGLDPFCNRTNNAFLISPGRSAEWVITDMAASTDMATIPELYWDDRGPNRTSSHIKYMEN